MHEKSEHELIADSKRGDEAAIAMLFERHYPSSLRVARGILHSDEESQDAVQSAFFSAFRHFDTFRGDSTFKTWITRIVVNRCLMQIRDPWRRFTKAHAEDTDENWEFDRLASSAPTPEKTAWCGEIAAAHDQAVASLPESVREAYMLYTISGLSIKEVAAALHVTLAAAKTRVFRARAGVRWMLQPVFDSQRSSAFVR